MKRLTLLLILIVILISFVTLPMTNADAKNSSPQMKTLAVSNASPAAEKTEISLAECPVWAQIVVVSVVSLFVLMAVVPLLVKEEKAHFPYPQK